MLNVYRLDSEEKSKDYEGLLSRFEEREPYFSSRYMNIFSGGFENLIYFLFESDETGATILMPGYLKPIVIGGERTSYFDFITPYGYTGPLFSPNISVSDIMEFWKCVDQWYVDNNVVTEFVRFNLLGNEAHYSGNVFPTMLNIKGKILDEENQWRDFDYKVRKNVNKAKREGLTSRIYFREIKDEEILEFHRIYIQTMERTNANASFSYSFEQFKTFITQNNNVAICTVYFELTPISSELLLISKDSIFSFLGGTNEEYFYKRPNDFLKIEALNWARNNEKKYYVLGGGYGFEDGIFKYKKSFFPNDVVNYFTGRKIVNNDTYNQLVEKANNFRIANGLEKLETNDTSFFPLYNKLN
ncbi:GNAT family N-acetyltransferase [uncultured Flavobacterium sp.]|uniref:GNAT family N-acetyltransferase n=1 Tax=uncultured Flavobacterium sp. TaxID=165435 RepID=UPI0011FF1D7C|nr:GNAT family N-acetyltransferase [uncultured Flavobacterium sp.]THD31528.1 MAG: GNAT family N-acetyltransferase [Flavobacterium johnsoniae]